MLKAIETQYAGCRFRSRLEARWAVLFDHLETEWWYEPEGFEVSWRLNLEPPENDFRYLPDFYLPEFNRWVEVKGSWGRFECAKFLNAAAHLADGGRGDMLICGPIPRDEWVVPWSLHMHKGDLLASPWGFRSTLDPRNATIIARDVGGDLDAPFDEARGAWAHHCPYDLGLWGLSALTERLLAGTSDGYYNPPSQWAAAMTAARSARFEHGESG